MKRRRDPYEDPDRWISRENRTLLVIGLPIILAIVALTVYFLTARG